jgi:hypothetical protein
MDAKELADKFSARVAAAATELHHQITVASDSAKSRLDDVPHIRKAIEEQVIPFCKSRDLERLPLAETRRGAAFKATQRRLGAGKRISEPRDTW